MSLAASHFGAAVETFIHSVEGWQDRLSQAEAATEVTTVPLAQAMASLLLSRA